MGLISTIDNIFLPLRFLPCFSVSITNLMLFPAFISPYHPRLTHSSTEGLSRSPPISHADNKNPGCSCFCTLSAPSLPHCHGYPIISTISTQPQAWLSPRWSWLLHPIGTGSLEPERLLYYILPVNWIWQGLNLPSLIWKGNVKKNCLVLQKYVFLMKTYCNCNWKNVANSCSVLMPNIETSINIKHMKNKI